MGIIDHGRLRVAMAEKLLLRSDMVAAANPDPFVIARALGVAPTKIGHCGPSSSNVGICW